MTSRQSYVLAALAFVVGLGLILAFPEPSLTLLLYGVPIAIGAAAVSLLYLVHVFRRQTEPRSRFFKMVLEAFGTLLILGAWVGYLTIVRLAERSGTLAPGVWAPPPSVSSPVSALLVIVLFLSLVRFAASVALIRWRGVVTDEDSDITANVGEPVA